MALVQSEKRISSVGIDVGTSTSHLVFSELILKKDPQSKTEKYHVGDRVQALLWEVRDTENGGAEVVLSRSHPEMVEQLFKQEVPELMDETVGIKNETV